MKKIKDAVRLAKIVGFGFGVVLGQIGVVGLLAAQKIIPGRKNETTVFGMGRSTMARAFHREVLKNLNIEVETEGQQAAGLTLMLPNHLGHLDSSIIGAHTKDRVFIGKGEIGKWPVVGWIVRKFGVITVQRDKDGLAHMHYKMAKAFSKGLSVAGFAESTTSSGSSDIGNTDKDKRKDQSEPTDEKYMRNFRQGLLKVLFSDVAKDRNGDPIAVTGVKVQPLAIRLTRVNGQDVGPDDQNLRDFFAWYDHVDPAKDIGMLTHIFTKGLAVRKIEAKLSFLDPIDPEPFLARPDGIAALTKAAQDAVRAKLAECEAVPSFSAQQRLAQLAAHCRAS